MIENHWSTNPGPHVVSCAYPTKEAYEKMKGESAMMAADSSGVLGRIVVEAEKALASYKEDMDEWSYMEYDGRKHKVEDLAPGLCEAIVEAKALLKENP